MHTTLSIHDTKDLVASTTGTMGAPLQLRTTSINNSGFSSAEVTLYTNDQTLTDRLIVAINEVVAARKAELASVEQVAA